MKKSEANPVKATSRLGEMSEALLALVRREGADPLTMRGFAAMVLLREGPLQVGELGRRLEIHKTTAWRVVNGLQNKGLVHRVEVNDASDKRVRSQVELLPEGLRCVDLFAAKLH